MNKGTLYTSYFAKMKQAKIKGGIVSVSRFNPKWIKEEDLLAWCKSLSPSENLLHDYKHNGINWDEYTRRYLIEIGNSKQASVDISSIATSLTLGNNLVLMCYEKSSDNCHRHLLGELFKLKGFNVEEI